MNRCQLIECFHGRPPVDETDLECPSRGGDVALELAERQAMAFLLRCTSLAGAGAAALSALAFGLLLTGFGGH
ncbi:MAG TPA: hypothetical protein QGI07_02075 [Dehalococcoidia bacterium]|jgi:hypothetical protein|nr:hypothetical protein [Chloroflexota bacterium]MDP5877448.1 hypothetical protein [Dehalococcoidia bacterium]MDP6272483.1 hypothetical protein [Dehalococcoidia bacterium]MDP7161147.1 hypothetical protein [Dehalococcoidia bacterium]MDP7213055.1 hypothetical protein [Dehalococcoidia bacterium]|tara:strand:- start:734 stop:952 length:219 start_codon:yes stop_codon:yes gene_type:complete